jgi:purine nucleosidase
MYRLIGLCPVLLALLAPVHASAPAPQSVWVDTDAACGVSALKDIDDCLALLMLLKAKSVKIVGVSSVFGNTERKQVDEVLAAFSIRAKSSGISMPEAVPGAVAARDCQRNAAAEAIANALSKAPMRIVLFGPATNLACALEAHPNVVAKLTDVVAVMGARSGHVFHPAEGAPGAPFSGHGLTIVRDMNVQIDHAAIKTVLQSGVSLSLVPYETSRQISITQKDLAALGSLGPLESTLAEAGRQWVKVWTLAFGREEFYPFDAVAALYVVSPTEFICKRAEARVEADRAISGSSYGPQRLMIGALAWDATAPRFVTWCNKIRPLAKDALLGALGIPVNFGSAAR